VIEIPVTKDGAGSFLTSGFPEAFTSAPVQASWDLSRLILNASIRIRREAGALDWLLAHWAIPSGMAALAAIRSLPKGRRPRLALWCHSADVYALERIPDGGRIARMLFTSADKTWAVSNDLRERILSRTKRPDLAVRVLHPGVPIVESVPCALKKGPLRAVFVGRLEEIKGLPNLVRLFADRSNWSLTLVGAGSQERALKERAGSAPNISFLGAVSPERVRSILDEHHVLLLPGSREATVSGRSEGLPTVILEAFAAGRPVIAGDQGGVSELVDSEVGFLIPRGDIQALSDCLERLQRDYDLVCRLGRNARIRAESFDCEQIAGQIVRELGAVC